MRIALVTEVFLPAVDGVVRRLQRTLEELQRRGEEVLVIAPHGAPPRYAGAAVAGMRALPLPLYPDGAGYPPKRVSLPQPAMGRMLESFRPDVIHAVNPVLLAAGAVRHARRTGTPLVASYHAHLPMYAASYGMPFLEGFGWSYLRMLHNRACVNLCTSQATLQILRERGVQRLRLWPYGVDAQRPGPEEIARCRERLADGRPERVLLLYVGRLAKEKQIGRLRSLVEQLPDVALAIAGDGPLRADLEAEFAGTPTTFLGLLGPAELAGVYAAADIFVSASESETLGLVILEAHAAGLPVVAPATPVGAELVVDGRDGILYDPGRPGAVIDAVGDLLRDGERRHAMGAEGRRAVQGATWSGATDALREHYRCAIDVQDRHVRRPRLARRHGMRTHNLWRSGR